MSKKQTLLILQAPPANGKTTLAREMTRGDKSKEWIIVSRDSIRDALGEYWIPEREGLVSLIEENTVKNALSLGYNVILDATNLNPKYLDLWKSIAAKYDCNIEYKKWCIDRQEAIRRDRERDERGERAVGEKVINYFYDKYFLD